LKQAPYIHRLKVPFGHCDIAGIVYTPRFADYCIEAVEQFLQNEIGLNWYAINIDGDFSNPVMRMEVDFHHPVEIGDDLELAVRVTRIGRSSFTVTISGSKSADGSAAPHACFTGTLVLAFVDLKAKTSIPIPAAYLPGLEACVTEIQAETA